MVHCVVCKQEASLKCQCNRKSYCEKDYNKHSTRQGSHGVIKLDESPLVKKSVSFAGSDDLKMIDKSKDFKLEIDRSKTDMLRLAIEKELAKLQRFRTETLSCIELQQKSLIKTIIADSKNMSARVLAECNAKEELLEKTIQELEVVGKIPSGHPVIERLKKCNEDQPIMILESNLKKIEFKVENILEFNITWVNNPVIIELKEYFHTHQAEIPQKVQKIYQKIFAEKHHSIRRLNFSRSKIDSLSIKHLKRIIVFFPNTKELRLAGNKVNSENSELLAECLAGLKNLEILDLSDNDLRGHGIEILTPTIEEMKKLSVLNLSKNNFGATGARHLSLLLENLKKLKDLDLDTNGFGAEGARYLAPVLHKINLLKTLKLRNNNLADDSVRFLKVAFGKMANIKSLRLEQNKFGNEEKRTLQFIVRKECKLEM